MHAHVVFSFTVKFLIHILIFDIFQGNSRSQWNVTYVTPEKELSGSSQHQQAKTSHEDPIAGKRTTESDKAHHDDEDEDMDITECMPLYNVTTNTSSSHKGEETNSHPAGCKMQSESMELGREVLTLPCTKKLRLNYNNFHSGLSEPENKLKLISENAKKNQRKKRARSARINSRSLSKNTKSELRGASKEAELAKEAELDRYVICQQREPSSGM
jgi:hypothetical protein